MTPINTDLSVPAAPATSNATSKEVMSHGKTRASSRPDSPGQPNHNQSQNTQGTTTASSSHNQLQQYQAPLSPTTDMIMIDDDPFDVRETVNVLTLQFLSDHAETRIAALEWLLMLHLKAPNKVGTATSFANRLSAVLGMLIKQILSRESGTFPALLKTLSDPSEDVSFVKDANHEHLETDCQVVKHDLQLLAQISASSEEAYFTSFMSNVLELFSTDRRLLENRGSLIIRQLCLHLNAERIFRSIADILEKDDVSPARFSSRRITRHGLVADMQDLEFASMMVVKLNMILITSPELADFRRRLKNLDSRVS